MSYNFTANKLIYCFCWMRILGSTVRPLANSILSHLRVGSAHPTETVSKFVCCGIL